MKGRKRGSLLFSLTERPSQSSLFAVIKGNVTKTVSWRESVSSHWFPCSEKNQKTTSFPANRRRRMLSSFFVFHLGHKRMGSVEEKKCCWVSWDEQRKRIIRSYWERKKVRKKENREERRKRGKDQKTKGEKEENKDKTRKRRKENRE